MASAIWHILAVKQRGKWFISMLGKRSLLLFFSVIFSGSVSFAQPGTILLQDDFDNGLVACGTLAPNWTSDDPNLAGVDTFTSQSGSCSVFTRGGAVSVTSVVVDTSGITGATLTAWVQKGDDSFSEDPDSAAENLVLEYFDVTGNFVALQTFSAVTIADGAVTLVNVTLPFNALHSGFQLRFRQLGGSGGPPANGGTGFDFWHIDDVVLTETGVPPPPPPTPTLTANSCDDFESGLINWTPTDIVRSDINSDTSNSPTNSLFLRHGGVTTTSVAVSALALTDITVFVQRGSDTFSENPEAGEDLVIEFLDNTGNFVVLETFPGGGTPGEVFNRVYPAPASAQHAGFRLRFRHDNGSGSDFDYWHIDDVCLVSDSPDLSVVKTVMIESDPVTTGGSPFAVPGAFALYTIEVTNTGMGVVDADSLALSDVISPDTVLFVGDLDGSGSPFLFTDGSGAAASGVTLNFSGLSDFSDGVTFRDAAGTAIVPTPDFDPTAASFDLDFTGTMLGASGGSPTSFSIQYRVRLE